jgi:hypothetical protein
MVESHEVVRRTLLISALKGGAAGVAVGIVALLIFLAASDCRTDATGRLISAAPGWECLGVAIMALGGALLMAPLLSWVALRLLRLEYAFAVAVCGTLATLLLVLTAPVAGPAFVPPAMVAGAVVGYGGAAVALSPQNSPWVKGMFVAGLCLFVVFLVRLF